MEISEKKLAAIVESYGKKPGVPGTDDVSWRRFKVTPEKSEYDSEEIRK